MSPAGRRAALAGYAAATFLAFPHPVGEGVVDLGWAFGWIAPGLLWLGLADRPPRRAARAAAVAGWAAHAALFHWIYVVTVTYGHAPPAAGVAAPAALALYPAAWMGALGAAWGWLARRGRGGPFAFAALWTVQDHLRAFALTGFPWGTLGYSQHENGLLLGLAPGVGVLGLSFLCALGGASVAGLARARWRRRPLPLAAVAGVALVVASHGVGFGLGRLTEPTPAGRVRVAVLQGNIDQGVKWSPAWSARTLEVYEDLSRRAAAEGARVILWPETAVPGALEADPRLRHRVGRLARELGAVLVVGGVGVEREGEALRFYDSAFTFDASGRLLDRYDKAHLVPFGEYVPLRPLLGSVLGAVASGIAPGDVTPGAGPRPVAIPDPEGQGVVTAGVPICYELLFPDLVRRFVGGGAEVLFALTNDAWYGRTGAPYQFLAMTALRSAENRVWTARAANSGVSAIIDSRGRVRARTRIFERDLLVADVPLLRSGREPGPYTRFGDSFAWACWIGLGGGAVARRRPEREDA